MSDSKAVVVWVPPHERPEYIEAQRKKQDLADARQAEALARKAKAEAQEKHDRMMATGRQLVLTQLEKLLKLAQSPDFADAPGPIEMKDLIKLAEVVAKDHRLATGQSTENVAHAVRASVDFSQMTPEEREQWRKLAVKGGANDG